ncbi:MAG: fimbrillin family protein [Candidatus Cryptobacteroides sp.]
MKKNHYKLMERFYISAALVLLMAVSCSKSGQGDYYSDPNAVHFSAVVGSDTKTSPVGSAEEQAQFSVGDKVAISDGGAFFTYVLGSEGWAPENPAKFIRWTSASTTFKAYYPVRDGVSFSSASLPADQSTDDAIASADWMTASSTVSKPQSGFNVDLQFQRKTARVKVTIDKFLDEFDGKNPTIQSLSVCGTDASMVSVDGVISYYALLLPRSADADREFLTLTVNSKDLVVRGIPALEEGKTYSFSLTVGKNTVKIANVMVSDWGSGSESNGEAIN